jgi:hypothetical protein
MRMVAGELNSGNALINTSSGIFSSSVDNGRPQLISLSRYRKHLIVVAWSGHYAAFNTMRENAHGETDPR